jgi:hypothetical protein
MQLIEEDNVENDVLINAVIISDLFSIDLHIYVGYFD